MNPIKTSALKVIAVISLCTMFFVAGCSQQTTADLVRVLGNATAAVASLEGNTVLATKLQTDTAVAVTQVENWKTGTPAQNVSAALQLVEADLNLFPQTTLYAPLIDLAITTVSSILDILQPSTASVKRAHVNAPQNKKDFTKKWNAIVKANPALAKAKI